MLDSWETVNGLNTSTNDAYLDNDGDALYSVMEFWEGTCPTNSDSDGDSELDGAEFFAGSDPTDANDYTLLVTPVAGSASANSSVTVEFLQDYIIVNDGDDDSDGVPDDEDGYDEDETGGTDDDWCSSISFCPVQITVSEDLSPDSLKFQLIHSDNIRVWLRNGTEFRRLAAADGSAASGSLVSSDLIPLRQMGSLGRNAWTIYVEALAPGNAFISLLNGLCHNGTDWEPWDEQPPGDRAPALKVSSVRWDTYVDTTSGANRALDTNPFPGTGKRIFPDKIAESDLNVGKRRKVHAVAALSSAVAGVTVYFKAFDVDDPSSSAAIDKNDTSGATGEDNIGGLTGRNLTPVTTSAITDSTGEAKAVFTVTRYPGDNFEVVAGCSQPTVAGVEQALAQSAYHLRDIKALLERPQKQESFTFMDKHPLIRDMGEYTEFLDMLYPNEEAMEVRL